MLHYIKVTHLQPKKREEDTSVFLVTGLAWQEKGGIISFVRNNNNAIQTSTSN